MSVQHQTEIKMSLSATEMELKVSEFGGYNNSAFCGSANYLVNSIAQKNKSNPQKLKLKSIVKVAVNQHGEKVNGLESWAEMKLHEAITYLSKINFLEATFELTNEVSGIFCLDLGVNKKLFLEIYFEPLEEVGYSQEAFFNYLENGECIYNGIGSLSDVLLDIKNLIA